MLREVSAAAVIKLPSQFPFYGGEEDSGDAPHEFGLHIPTQ